MYKSRFSAILKASLESMAPVSVQLEEVDNQEEVATVVEPEAPVAVVIPPEGETPVETPAEVVEAAEVVETAEPAPAEVVVAEPTPAPVAEVVEVAEPAAEVEVPVVAEEAAPEPEAAAPVPAAEPVVDEVADVSGVADPNQPTAVEHPLPLETAAVAAEAEGETPAVVAEVVPSGEPAAEPVVEDEPTETGDGSAVDTTDVEYAPVVDTDCDSDSAVMLDASDAEAEVRETEDQTDRLVEISTGLEAICNELHASLEDGGLTPQAARLLHLAMESQTAPLGLEVSVVPSVESFESPTGRVRATEISLESAKEILAQVMRAIKAVLAKAWQAIKRFWQYITDAGKRLRMRAVKLMDAAKSAKGNPKQSSLTLGSLVGKLNINGKVESNLINGLVETDQVMKGLTDLDVKAFQVNGDIASALNRAMSADSDEAAQTQLDKFATLPKFAKSAAYATEKEADGVATYYTPTLPGNVKFFITDASSGLKSGVEQQSGNMHANAETKVATLSVVDIRRIGKLAMEIGKFSESYAKDSKLYANETIPGLKESAAANASISDETSRKLGTAIKSFARNYNEERRASMRVLNHGVRTAMAYMDLAEQSLAQYTGSTASMGAPKSTEEQMAGS